MSDQVQQVQYVQAEEKPGCAASFVIIFDLIIALTFGFTLFPEIHTVFKILLTIAIYFVAMFVMNITKFKIGVLGIIGVSVLCAAVVDTVIDYFWDLDQIWTWTWRIVAFLMCFFGHKRLTVWHYTPIFKINKE